MVRAKSMRARVAVVVAALVVAGLTLSGCVGSTGRVVAQKLNGYGGASATVAANAEDSVEDGGGASPDQASFGGGDVAEIPGSESAAGDGSAQIDLPDLSPAAVEEDGVLMPSDSYFLDLSTNGMEVPVASKNSRVPPSEYDELVAKFPAHGSPNAQEPYSVTIDGDRIAVPCLVSDLLGAGWSDKRSGSSTYLPAPSEVISVGEYAVMNLFKNGTKIEIALTPKGLEPAGWSDCLIVRVLVNQNWNPENPLRFKTFDGVTQESTLDDVLELYGRPTGAYWYVDSKTNETVVESLDYSAIDATRGSYIKNVRIMPYGGDIDLEDFAIPLGDDVFHVCFDEDGALVQLCLLNTNFAN